MKSQRLFLLLVLLLCGSARAQTNQLRLGQFETNNLTRYFNGVSVPNTSTNNLYTNYVFSTQRGNFNGLVGLIWTNNVAISVNALGTYVLSSNRPPKTLSLVLWTNKTLIASAVYNSTNNFQDGFGYTNIAPVTLLAGAAYVLCQTQTNGTTLFADKGIGLQAQFSTGTYGQAVYSVDYTFGSLTVDGGGTGRPYGPLDLKYTFP